MTKIPYGNTKEGMHETAKANKIKAWALGCSCEECNKEFEAISNDPSINKEPQISKELADKIDAEYEELFEKDVDMNCYCHNNKHWKPGWHTSDCWMKQHQAKLTKPESVGIISSPKGSMAEALDNKIWNKAITSAADMLALSYPDNVSTNAFCAAIRSLKK